ncbi:TonB-dependent receptor [Aureisphaera galaxeae]|uniref:TonB-dependent receptor domain-containing protein n=1 Tax=Aureisphaera galaxeae TaxID=1538023 RepID=UPI002350A2EF|nr:TonB-dependent receptor [Aureisphaera galaxeae]MDC8005442.1 TonB-dependent receptor [Aureisphaera galaxeae]
MRHFVLLMALFVGLTSFAAEDPAADKIGKITGTVIDKNLNEPIPYVTVAVQTIQGEIITGGVTDDNGKFTIKDIPEGKSRVVIQYIGYKTYSVEIDISRRNRNVDLGSIMLEEDVEALDEVTVTAERTTIQQKLDRKVITVGKDLTTSGPTAADIMNNLPSVSVDQQTGVLSLRGNSNVRVMVDGKLTNVPIAQLLKQIPSTSIKQIELITNPSAKYNPEGMSGIVNIILHKNVNIGFNGNANVAFTYEEQPKFNSSIDMNYRNGKLNFYGNWGHNTSKNENFGNILRPGDDTEQLFEFLDDNQSNLVKLGVDFYLNDKNTISFFTNQNFFEGATEGVTDIVDFQDANFSESQLFLQESDNMSGQYNFNYKVDFAKEGHNLELEADYNIFDNEEDADFDFAGNNPSSPNYEDFIDTERDRLTINLDYVNPLTESTKLELGLEARLFNSEIGRTTDQQVINPFNVEGALVSGPSTDFDYQRDIYSAYFTYGKSWEKFSVQVGARAEMVDVVADTKESYEPGIVTDDLTNVDTDPGVQVTRDGDDILKNFTNDYFQVYPSAFVTYTPSEKNQFQLSYSRRVDRPGLEQINPIREWSTPRISSFGKTSLIPQFTNSFETNYTRNLGKGSITAGVFYRIIEDEINRALFVDRTDLNKVILTYDNFENTSAYGLEVSSNYRATKWWSFSASFDLFNQTQKGISERLATQDNPTADDIISERFEVDNLQWNVRMFNNFRVNKVLTLSAFGFYRGESRTLQFTLEPMYFVNVGARVNLWEGRGTFSLNYNDIFDTMQFGFEGELPYVQTGAFNWESNTVNVSLAYRFGGGKYRAKSRKRRDNDEKSGSGGIF